ncbi:MAG: Fur family transcriptional regulator [Aristaeellaceae bacterium]
MVRRNTFQRSIVLDAVKTLQCHATADEIYEHVRQTCPTISRATVYRNLQQLCEMGEIRRRELPGSPDRYDHLTTNHYHVRCRQCGRVTDVDMPYLPQLTQSIRDAHGYVIDEHDIVFTGLCPECAQDSR